MHNDNRLPRRSNRLEKCHVQNLVAAIAEELWRRDHWLDLRVIKDVVDSTGFDLVMSCNGSMRFIQIQETNPLGEAEMFTLRQDFSTMEGGCAVVLAYVSMASKFDHFLFYGGGSGEAMAPISEFPKTQSQRQPTGDWANKMPPDLRDVPRKNFQGPLSISELVNHLFPQSLKQNSIKRTSVMLKTFPPQLVSLSL